jgi:hypothetical protein
MSDEELIKAIEERANKLGIKINLRYDFGSAVGRMMRNDARGTAVRCSSASPPA